MHAEGATASETLRQKDRDDHLQSGEKQIQYTSSIDECV
jgi:hypothetical protein